MSVKVSQYVAGLGVLEQDYTEYPGSDLPPAV